jgi:aldehyde:ferredoxin oxidoreductase
MEPNQYLYRQVSYDHEPIFAMGSMLGVTDAFKVLALIDAAEKMGVDVMSAGVALAWATEATERGLLSEKETGTTLRFGDAAAYRDAIVYLGRGENEFYRLLSQGTLKTARQYGGAEFACVLGQEMAGYATGEAFFASQALGFRHSHLDSGGYSYDQKQMGKDAQTGRMAAVPADSEQEQMGKDAARTVDFLVQDEKYRVFLTSMVSCLFAREAYKEAVVAECLGSLGYKTLAGNMNAVSTDIQKLRWKIRLATGFDHSAVEIPKRFTEVVTLKGPVDPHYLNVLKEAYSKRILELGKQDGHQA